MGNEWIIERKRAGDSVAGIAEALGVDDVHVYKVLVDWIIERIRNGDSQASIAKALRCSPGTVSLWLDRDADTIERSARARAASAEAWLDKGLEVIESALKREDGVDSTAARAYAQECARRAAVRNPAYREKTGVEITGAKGGPIVTIAPTCTPEQAAALYKEILG